MSTISIFGTRKLSFSVSTKNTGGMTGDGGQNTLDMIHRIFDKSMYRTVQCDIQHSLLIKCVLFA